METGRFTWPPVRNGVVTVSPAQMAMLLEGLDWSRVRRRPVETPEAAC
ncbi:IS66 family insertion sequence element accessory protein TnpB [Caenispirillum salinarum]